MKKILCVITTSFIIGGGLTNSYMNYYCNFKKGKYHVDFASTNEISEGLSELLKERGSAYYNLGKRKKFFQYSKRLTNLIKKNKYDIIHVHGNSGTIALDVFSIKKSKVYCKIATHCHTVSTNHPIIHKCLRWYVDKNSDFRLGCSEQATKWMFKNNKSIIIKNCVELEKYKFDEEKRKRIREELNLKENDFVFGHVGRFNKAKNQIYLIKNMVEILKKEHNYLVLVGGGKTEKKVRQEAEKRGVDQKIKFVGFKSNVSDYMSSFDLFLFPSLFEGFGMVVIEAQLSGLNCVVSDTCPKELNVCGKINFFKLKESNDFKKIIEEKNVKLKDRGEESCFAIRKMVENQFTLEDNLEVLYKVYDLVD